MINWIAKVKDRKIQHSSWHYHNWFIPNGYYYWINNNTYGLCGESSIGIKDIIIIDQTMGKEVRLFYNWEEELNSL